MADNMEYPPIGDLYSRGESETKTNVQSSHLVSADNLRYQNEFSTELGKPPEGGFTGDLSGRHEILAPWTCEDCPDPMSVVPGIAHDILGSSSSQTCLAWGDLWSNPIAFHERLITTWPERCRSCDTRYKQHKRTVNAIVKIWRHPKRMEKFENTWVYLRDQKYRYLKFITLTEKNREFPLEPPAPDSQVGSLSPGGGSKEEDGYMHDLLLAVGDIKEKFRRFRKKKFWKEHVVYGRWFFEVTWTVHYADGSSGPTTQWMPGEKELEGATSIEVHPHLHVIAVAEFMDKEALTEWWGAGTQIQAVDSWWSTKQYLTKYLNKSQMPGRNQGGFGKWKKQE